MKSLKFIYILFASVLIIAGCKKGQGPDMNYAIPAASNLSITDIVPRKATITWDYKGTEANLFTVEVSTSSTFAIGGQVKMLKFNAEAEKKIALDSLGSLVTYYVRVQALNGDPMFTSAYTVQKFVSGEIETIFNPIVKADLTASSVLLSWKLPKKGSVTHIDLKTAAGVAVPRVNLTPAQITAQKVLVTGLQQATTYKAIIYEAEENKGEATFNTRDPNEAITVNASSVIYETLQDAIDAAVSGDIINIGNAKYDFSDGSNITITNKSITIKALSSAARPEITSKQLDLIGNVSSLKLSGLKLIGKSSYSIVATGITGASNITVENCEFTGPTAGLIYVAATGTAANVTFNLDNSICHDFGATGGDFIDFRAGTLSGMRVTNSTFYKVARDFFRIDAITYPTGNAPVLVENCTFNNVCGMDGAQGRFMYIRVVKVTGYTMMKINKCILTNKYRSTGNGVTPIVEFNTNNVFGNSSTEWAGGTVSTGTTTLDPQYLDVVNNNFTVGNATIKAAGLGDPRWLK